MQATLLGHAFTFAVTPGLFSADVVDDGTRLLLDHLPAGSPADVLDMGCGYGALGLPVCAAFPAARVLMVDRDCVAVEWCRRNATGLPNAEVMPSLGFRDVDAARRFDWVLSNVPARIGKAGVAHLLVEGARRLRAGGELRAVVIRDLAPQVEAVTGAVRVAEGSRHFVYALGPGAGGGAVAAGDAFTWDKVSMRDGDREYALDRPSDVGEDPAHLKAGLPLLLECLPAVAGKQALLVRCGYGNLAVPLAARGARVTAVDRDLVQLAYVERNAGHHGLTVSTRAGWHAEAPLAGDERFDLVVLEATAHGSPVGVAEEVAGLRARLRPGGRLVVLCRGGGVRHALRGVLGPVAEREGWVVLSG